jgi:Cellulase (glycosyl hydrolase family 5)
VRLLAVLAALVALLAFALPGRASASPSIRYGIQDDAWIRTGPGSLESRLDRLQSLGVHLVRLNVRWSDVQPRPGVYDWSGYDDAIAGLHARNIETMLTLYSTPGWANGGRATNWAPTSGATFASFARHAAQRYPYVRRWLIWNEPNQRRWLRPTTPETYVKVLLNPGYAAIHAVHPRALVGGGVTAPRASTGGVSPVAWIDGMAAAGAKLDAYAHNPYSLNKSETPTSGGCDHCSTITMSTLPRLLAKVGFAFGTSKRVWLTEFGYQTNPPDRSLGVSKVQQMLFMSESALRAYLTPRVDMLIQFLIQDEPELSRWQSGVLTTRGQMKPSYAALQIPIAVRARTGRRTTLWAQVRPGNGVRRYRLEQLRNGVWRPVGGTARTSPAGYVNRVVFGGPGAMFRILDVVTGSMSPVLVVR